MLIRNRHPESRGTSSQTFFLRREYLRSIALAVFSICIAIFRVDAAGWKLVWSDEFNGTTINTGVWGNEIGYIRNNELQYYTSRTNNARIENGNLVIEAKQESYSGYAYTSASLNTKGKMSWQYGRVEMRAKLPYGQGMWPAFWLMGNSGGWPACGEIDIMEMIGGGAGRDNRSYATIHWYGTNHKSDGSSMLLPYGIFSDAYHIFGMEWDASRIKFYIDGTNFTTKSITAADQTEFHQPFYILINLAVGGDWPGSPNASTVFPQIYYVDWVRVYQIDSNSNTTAPIANNQAVTVIRNQPTDIHLNYTDAQNDQLYFSRISGPSNGTLIGIGPDLRYTPNTGFIGNDSFTYRVSDSWAVSSNAVVTITVRDAAPTVTGVPAGFITNAPFTFTIDVNTNYGYWSTNASAGSAQAAWYQFTTAGTNILIDRTLTFYYFGRDAVGTASSTNSSTYTFDTTAPTVSGAPANLTTNAVFTIPLAVSENHGWFSTNGTAYYQFTVAGTNILIDRTLTLSYFGRDTLGNTSATNTRTYTVNMPPAVSGAPAGCMTNRTFIIALTVDKNYGYYSTNGSSFVQLTTSGVTITVDRTTTLRYFGSNAAGVSVTNTRTYTFDTAAPVISGAPNDLATNRFFTVSLSVNENYGYVSLNPSTGSGQAVWHQFTTAGTNVSITGTTSMSYFGCDALGNTSATNTRIYTVTIITGLQSVSVVGYGGGIQFLNIPDNTRGAVFSVSGRHIANLSVQGSGLVWDKRDTPGRSVSPGVYLCKLTSPNDTAVVKIMVLQNSSSGR